MKVSKEIKIALVAVLSAIIIYVGIIFLKGLKLFNDEVSYFVEIANVQGMPTASDVRANGLKIGTVKAINFNSDRQNLTVEITINPNFKIPQGTSVYMTKEMLGSAMMNLRLGPDPTDVLQPGDTIKGSPMVDLMTEAGNLLPKVESMLTKVDSILGAVNTIANNPAIETSLDNMAAVSSDLRVTTQRINGLLSKDVPQLMAKTNVICTNLETTTNAISEIDVAGMARKADATLSGVQEMTFKINTAMNSKDNSLGMLMNDNSIALHVDSTLQNSSRLLEDLRLHPKRYVHFSLFGRKDKEKDTKK
ncbi:MAG: MCE family protein [Bacteroidaceae bacterium]|nr:MCE family protein [Bacteroidaceae bacterium]